MKIAVIGGDARLLYGAQTLQRLGHSVTVTGFSHLPNDLPAVALEEAARTSQAILLPLPYTKDRVSLHAPFAEVPILLHSLHFPSGTSVYCGKADLALRGRAEAGGWHLYDYANWESFAAANAIPSAEGALALAMKQLPCTLFRLPVIVVGGGRIARHLVKLLIAYGAKVTLCARRDTDRLWGQTMGCESIDFSALPKAAVGCRLLYNTVPAPVVGRQVLSALPKEVLLIDLASAPGGVDFEAAKALELQYFHALSLPASYAPESAGVLLGELVDDHLKGKQEGIL